MYPCYVVRVFGMVWAEFRQQCAVGMAEEKFPLCF